MIDYRKKSVKIRLKRDFQKLTEWLDNQGFSLKLYTDAPDEVRWHPRKEVHINTRNGMEKRLHVFLHECGHILVCNNSYDRSIMLSSTTDGRCTRGRAHAIARIGEEYEAWKRGERLANRLNITINAQKFDKFKTQCLMSYVNWASDEETGD